MSLTRRMADWVEVNKTRLRNLDHAAFRVSKDDRDKPSAHLLLQHDERFGEVIVWDSGEVELSFGTANATQDEHHEVDNPAELDELLANLVGRVE